MVFSDVHVVKRLCNCKLMQPSQNLSEYLVNLHLLHSFGLPFLSLALFNSNRLINFSLQNVLKSFCETKPFLEELVAKPRATCAQDYLKMSWFKCATSFFSKLKSTKYIFPIFVLNKLRTHLVRYLILNLK